MTPTTQYTRTRVLQGSSLDTSSQALDSVHIRQDIAVGFLLVECAVRVSIAALGVGVEQRMRIVDMPGTQSSATTSAMLVEQAQVDLADIQAQLADPQVADPQQAACESARVRLVTGVVDRTAVFAAVVGSALPSAGAPPTPTSVPPRTMSGLTTQQGCAVEGMRHRHLKDWYGSVL